MARCNWKQLTSDLRIPKQQKKDEKQNYRSEIESDYLRIIRSASIRRLQDKTQVFPLDKSDFVRTRLTHSMEVSSIAKVIGRQVCEGIVQNKLEPMEDLPNALDVVEILNCSGLLHDIGNPPFGHFGETAIRNWFAKNLHVLQFEGKYLADYLSEEQKLDLLYYEGNAQALRIITKLHRLKGNHGMHLTSSVMDTIIKYPCSSLEKQEEDKKSKRRLSRKKIGYFQSEKQIFQQIKQNTQTLGHRHPLTFILEAADDLAYTFADLEDGFNKGLYSYDQLLDVVKESGDKNGQERLEKALQDAKAIKETKEKGFDPYRQAVFQWLTQKQFYCISQTAKAFLNHYEAIMQGTFEQELLQASSESVLIKNLKKFSFDRIYNGEAVLKLELMGNEVLTFLLDRFMKALILYDSDETMSEIEEKYIDLLSRNYLDNYHRSTNGKSKEEKLYERLLLGCDFIAGMSDSYAKRLYQELKGIL